MMESYFQHQTDLAKQECKMQCPDDCSAPGCRLAEVIVEATLFDLIRLSLVLNTPVSSLFLQHCHLGLQSCEQNHSYHRLLIKLKKPCHFLEKTRCAVHGSKPLACVLFPEYHQVKGLAPELVKGPIFRKFPCLKGDILISDQRSTALKMLRKMSNREEALSGFFLFETPHYIIDSKPLTKQLKKENPNKKPIALKAYDRLINAKLKPTGLFDSINAKISRLDTRAGMESLFEKLADDELMKPLLEKRASPEIVYKLKGNSLKRLKRRLQPSEFYFR
jgi:Fe-S-cluster containining protein